MADSRSRKGMERMRKLDPHKKQHRKQVRRAAMLVLSVFLLTGSAMQAGLAVQAEETAAEADGTGGGTDAELTEAQRQLQITVVEDIPAVDIEEDEVPLAALPNTRTRSGRQHVLWMGALLLAVIAYAAYFSAYDRRLSGLRRKAAGMEKRLMDLRRKGMSEEKHEQ